MGNYIRTETLEACTINVLAPGASKNCTKIRLIKDSGKKDDAEHSILIEVDPITSPELKDVDLKISDRINIDRRYDTNKIKAIVKKGIVTIEIKIDSEKVKTINIEE